jgi:hypothetical protein
MKKNQETWGVKLFPWDYILNPAKCNTSFTLRVSLIAEYYYMKGDLLWLLSLVYSSSLSHGWIGYIVKILMIINGTNSAGEIGRGSIFHYNYCWSTHSVKQIIIARSKTAYSFIERSLEHNIIILHCLRMIYTFHLVILSTQDTNSPSKIIAKINISFNIGLYSAVMCTIVH